MSNDYPEMTAAEQTKRRAELQAHIAKQTDNSGYYCKISNQRPCLVTPDETLYFGAPPVSPKYLSAGKAKGDSKSYSECPICGEIHDSEDEAFWRAHWMTHVKESEKAADMKEQLASTDPLFNKINEYSNESQYGNSHMVRWMRAGQAIGDPRYADSFLTPMTLKEIEENYNRFSKSRWGPVLERAREMAGGTKTETDQVDHSLRPGSPEWRRKQFEDRITDNLPEWTHAEAFDHYSSIGHRSYQAPRRSENGHDYWIGFEMCDDGNERQVNKPIAKLAKRIVKTVKPAAEPAMQAAKKPEYIYGEDLENARHEADEYGNTLHWIAISAEISCLMTGKMFLPKFVGIDTVDQVESEYPKIQLRNVRNKITGRK